MKYDVILTGAESRQGIVTIRSLAARGLRLMVTGEQPKSIGFYSKHVSGFAYSPSSMEAKEDFVAFHVDLAKRHGIPAIFPVTESSLVPLNELRADVEEVATLIAPSSYTVEQALDKKSTLAIAEQEGIPISKTLYPTAIDEAVEFAETAGYPVILKPRGRANDSRIGASFDFKVLYAKNREQLSEYLSRCEPGRFPMMQEFSYGTHTQFNCFMERDRVHSYFQDEAIRLLPMTGGVGTMMCSRTVIPELAERSIRLYRAMNWEGCGQAQYKGPGKDGEYRFIEVSVRLPASVGSSVYSGIDTPWMQYCYFTGRPVPSFDEYTIGKRTRWLRGDTLTVVKYLVGDTPEAVDPLPSRPKALLDWFVEFFRPGVKNYIESFTDPKPGLYELRQTVVDVARVVGRKLPSPLIRFLKPIRSMFARRT